LSSESENSVGMRGGEAGGGRTRRVGGGIVWNERVVAFRPGLRTGDEEQCGKNVCGCLCSKSVVVGIVESKRCNCEWGSVSVMRRSMFHCCDFFPNLVLAKSISAPSFE